MGKIKKRKYVIYTSPEVLDTIDKAVLEEVAFLAGRQSGKSEQAWDKKTLKLLDTLVEAKFKDTLEKSFIEFNKNNKDEHNKTAL